jgi:hypothetical protein
MRLRIGLRQPVVVGDEVGQRRPEYRQQCRLVAAVSLDGTSGVGDEAAQT